MANSTTPRAPRAVVHYKLLCDGKSHNDYAWSLPMDDGAGGWTPGDWQYQDGPLVQCANGLHLTTEPAKRFSRHALDREGSVFYIAEPDGLVLDCGEEIVASRARLLRPVSAEELLALGLVVQEVPAPTVPFYVVLHDGEMGGVKWSLPSRKAPGDWHEIEGLLTRGNGLRITSDPKPDYQNGREVYRVEVEGNVVTPERGIDHDYIARKARILFRLMPADLDKLGVGVEKSWRASPYRRPSIIRKRAPEGMSPALKLLSVVHEHALTSSRKKGENLFNSVMSDAFNLAIKAGMEFALGDFAAFTKMRSGAWLSNEWAYAQCVESGNASACKSWEAWQTRVPFMWQSGRLYVGASIPWAGRKCKVTSIDDKAGTINVCSYKERAKDEEGYVRESTKIDRRFTVDRPTLAVADKRKKIGDALLEEVEALRKSLKDDGDATVDPNLIALWTLEQRDDAKNWARLVQSDGSKKRVKPPAKPEHVVAAEAVTTARKVETDAAWEEWRASSYRANRREVTGGPIDDAQSAVRKWAEAMFEGCPADYVKEPKKAAA